VSAILADAVAAEKRSGLGKKRAHAAPERARGFPRCADGRLVERRAVRRARGIYTLAPALLGQAAVRQPQAQRQRPARRAASRAE
jgi:hypothetical protein